MDRRVVAPVATGNRAAVKLVCPPDKSLTHRALMLAGMATGDSVVYNPLLGADCRSTMEVLRRLGVEVRLSDDDGKSSGRIEVRSPGWESWTSPTQKLDFGNSGTTARLMIGLLAASSGVTAECCGDASLSSRPMGRIVKPLRLVGADIDGPDDGTRLPLTVRGRALSTTTHVVDKASAQVKSALLLAGLRSAGTTTVTLPIGSRDHTELLLARLGADCRVSRVDGLETVTLTGPFLPAARDYEVPADPSSAAFFSVLAGIVEGLAIEMENICANPTRTGFVPVLQRMGAELHTVQNDHDPLLMEDVFNLRIAGGTALKPVEVEAQAIPTMVDEIPILAVAAMFAAGCSRFAGLAELRVKESDRLAAALALLHAGGADARIDGDDLVVNGGMERAAAFEFDPAGDHRLAMAAAVLACRADGPCTILGPECVDVSFPGFFDLLESVR